MSDVTVNEIFRQSGDDYRKNTPGLTLHQKKIIRAIQVCRTPELGGRIEVCDSCGHTVQYYHSCRNRHCPQCQFMKKEAWIKQKKDEIFPFQYFHLVFTLPHELIPLVIRNKRIMYDLLFQKVKETLLSVSQEDKYFGARIGFFGILHTWGQKLNLHPHLHCVVPGGGVVGKKWIRSPRDFLFPVAVLKKRFRSLYLPGLKDLYLKGFLDADGTLFSAKRDFQKLIDSLFHSEWIVYIKESFRNSNTVLEYLSRYTHRIAISNHRILELKNGQVSFSYKDYRENNCKKLLTLPAENFINRFMLHTLPPRYVRIRYYGVMSNRNRKASLQSCRGFFHIKPKKQEKPVPWDQLMLRVTGRDVHCCPCCGKGTLFPFSPLDRDFGKPPPETVLC
jgi:hypothetical protein